MNTLRLEYVRQLEQRSLDDIKLVVIHCTELPDLKTARRYGERVQYPTSGTGNSGHFYIDRDGTIQEWVPCHRIAHHVRGWNDRSIGIELVNKGRFPDWLNSRRQTMNEPYSAQQVNALIGLLAHLFNELPSLELITGHQQLDTEFVPASDDPNLSVRRKLDPGPLFPWSRILEETPLSWFEPRI